jgi:hypothetical protein
MQSVSVRNLRGSNLRENARRGMPLTITNRNTLIGIFIPVTATWVEHLIDYNWSHLRQSIAESESSLPTASAVAALDDVFIRGGSIRDGQKQISKTRQEMEGFEQIQTALSLSASDAGQEVEPAASSVVTVRIGDLTARLIEKAGANGQSLAVTHDRELVGVIKPVTRSLVNFLIEQNMSRILHNIVLSERHIRTPGKMATLDESFYRAERLIDKAERITISLNEELRQLPADQPQSIASDGTVESNSSKVFLCHSSFDKTSVRDLRRRLLDDEIEPWFDEEDILPGQDWELAIRKAIRASDVVLVCLSRAAVSKIGYLQKEIKHVLDVADEQPEGAIFLIPVRLEPCDVPERLRRWQWVDLFEGSGYYRLLRALRSRNGN